MTLSIHPNRARGRDRAGFTLVEMLVVIGIIILLIGILLPALNIAYTHSVRNSMALQIQSISAALEAYKNDQRFYPTLDYNDLTTPAGASAVPPTASTAIMTAAYPASVLLCRALIAPGNMLQDGYGYIPPNSTNPPKVDNPVPGFTNTPNGQVYGPYLDPGRFKMVIDPVFVAAGVPQSTDPNNSFLADKYGHPILYFKANMSANVQATNGYVGYLNPVTTPNTAPPMFNLYDDQGSLTNPALCYVNDPGPQAAPQNGAPQQSLARMELMLGDGNANGMIDAVAAGQPTETPVSRPYILWSAGPDETFGVSLLDNNNNPINLTDPVALRNAAGNVPSLDDVTNLK